MKREPTAAVERMQAMFARACLGHPAIGTFWYPATEAERARERQLLGGEAMFMGADLPTPDSCN